MPFAINLKHREMREIVMIKLHSSKKKCYVYGSKYNVALELCFGCGVLILYDGQCQFLPKHTQSFAGISQLIPFVIFIEFLKKWSYYVMCAPGQKLVPLKYY